MDATGEVRLDHRVGQGEILAVRALRVGSPADHGRAPARLPGPSVVSNGSRRRRRAPRTAHGTERSSPRPRTWRSPWGGQRPASSKMVSPPVGALGVGSAAGDLTASASVPRRSPRAYVLGSQQLDLGAETPPESEPVGLAIRRSRFCAGAASCPRLGARSQATKSTSHRSKADANSSPVASRFGIGMPSADIRRARPSMRRRASIARTVVDMPSRSANLMDFERNAESGDPVRLGDRRPQPREDVNPRWQPDAPLVRDRTRRHQARQDQCIEGGGDIGLGEAGRPGEIGRRQVVRRGGQQGGEDVRPSVHAERSTKPDAQPRQRCRRVHPGLASSLVPGTRLGRHRPGWPARCRDRGHVLTDRIARSPELATHLLEPGSIDVPTVGHAPVGAEIPQSRVRIAKLRSQGDRGPPDPPRRRLARRWRRRRARPTGSTPGQGAHPGGSYPSWPSASSTPSARSVSTSRDRKPGDGSWVNVQRAASSRSLRFGRSSTRSPKCRLRGPWSTAA